MPCPMVLHFISALTINPILGPRSKADPFYLKKIIHHYLFVKNNCSFTLPKTTF